MGKRKRHGQRSQPAGFDNAIKRVLNPEHPEHIEGLSDTQVRITLPPCPDYDIEEHESVPIWIPPEVLVKSDTPIYAGSITIKADTYEQRIENAIQGLKEEQSSLGSDAAVATFMLTFFTCEIVAKSIIGHSKFKGTGRKSLPGSYTTEDVADALEKLKINFSQKLVDELFSTERTLASEMSARKLRDEIVHLSVKPRPQLKRDAEPEVIMPSSSQQVRCHSLPCGRPLRPFCALASGTIAGAFQRGAEELAQNKRLVSNG